MTLVLFGTKELKAHLSLSVIYIFKHFAQFPTTFSGHINSVSLFSVTQGMHF